MTDEEFWAARKRQERFVRLLQFGFSLNELRGTPPPYEDEGLWAAWETLRLETAYLIAVELGNMKPQINDWANFA